MNKGKELVKEIGFSLLDEGKTLRIRADGYSMYPAIKPGNIIYIEPIQNELSPLPGSIIAWKRGNGLVVHRLIRIISEGSNVLFITRGDSCSGEDKPVTMKQIAGRVVMTETSSGERIRSDEGLLHKPAYLYNRMLVWFISRVSTIMKKVKKI